MRPDFVARSVNHIEQALAPEPGLYWTRQRDKETWEAPFGWEAARLHLAQEGGARVWFFLERNDDGGPCPDWYMVGHEIFGPIAEPFDVD